MSAPPEVDRRIVESLVEEYLPAARGRRLLLVHGKYVGTAEPFTVRTADDRHRVHVVDRHSVLGILEAWQKHQHTHPDDGDLLVVTTGVDDEQLGWDVRAYAIHRSVRPVDRASVVAQRFGAVDVDPRLHEEKWLVEALLDAEPPEGWPRDGSVLTRDAAIRALIGVRLGRSALGDGALDIGALLDFSLDRVATARFAELPHAERDGIIRWLADTVGDAAALLLRLVADGRAADAVPLGIVGDAATGPDANSDATLALGGLIGTTKIGELSAFTEAVQGALERWVADAETRGDEALRERVWTVVRRAEGLAAQVGLTAALAQRPFLPSAFTARLHEFATALHDAVPDGPDADAAPEVVTRVGQALDAVRRHHLARISPERLSPADMAVRLMRWLARPAPRPASVAEGVDGHLADTAWVERALTTVWAGDPEGDPTLGHAYREVCAAVRARRGVEDETFAAHLARWARHADTTDPGGCLLVEQVLDRVALPLAKAPVPPVIVVLDGMSGAVAVDLADQLTAHTWTEVTAEHGRRLAAVSGIPSVTHACRAGLLTGRLVEGDQATEKDGFVAYWKRHRRPRRRTGAGAGTADAGTAAAGTDEVARLFHKADIGGDAGHRLSDPLLSALAAEDVVVGVVLNTIDDALDHGREGDRTAWQVPRITYLPELLDAARAYGRPVVLTSDHGHVLDRTASARVPASGVESARWRTGEAGDGEVALSGPRVLAGGNNGGGDGIVAAVREDLRYTNRRAGYHGGASVAEMTVPVLTFLPTPDTPLPTGWKALTPTETTPTWWTPTDPTAPPAGVAVKDSFPASDAAKESLAAPSAGKGAFTAQPAPGPDDAVPLFDVEPQGAAVSDGEAPAAQVEEAPSLGRRVVDSDVYAGKQAFVPKPPDRKVVAAVLDALVDADHRLPLSTVAEVAGRAARRPEFFVTTLQRLLNVDGYPVVSVVDGGRWVTLDVETLRVQFELDV